MAYAITDKPNTEAPSADYPFGRTRDKSPSLAGTPVTTLTHGDFHQFFAKLMDYAGITPNGLPDNDYSGWQLMEALMVLMGGVKTKIINIGAWDMNADGSVTVPHGVDFTKIRSSKAMVYDDASAYLFELNRAGSTFSDATNITLLRDTGGIFDSTSFDSLANRGFIIIQYTEEL